MISLLKVLLSKFKDTTVSNILVTEVANDMLIYLSGINKDAVGNIENISSISVKELKSLQYLAGFIIHKLCDFDFLRSRQVSTTGNIFQYYKHVKLNLMIHKHLLIFATKVTCGKPTKQFEMFFYKVNKYFNQRPQILLPHLFARTW